MGRPTVAVVGALALGCLACGGLWHEAVAESFSRMTVSLEASVPASDPRFETVSDLIDDGWIAAWEGHVGLGDSIQFDVALDDALADGSLDDGDVAMLREKGRAFDDHPVDADRRADLLAIKAGMDDEMRDEDGDVEPVPTGTSVQAWALPADVRSRLTAAGWTVSTCADSVEESELYVACMADKGGLAVSVNVERYLDGEPAETWDDVGTASHAEGSTVIEVTVFDGAAGEVLRDRLLPQTPLADVDPDAVRAALGTAGWEVTGCEDTRDGRMRFFDCDAVRGQSRASVSLELQPGGRGRQQRTRQMGIAMVMQGRSTASVTVLDGSAGQALLAELLQ